MSDEQHTPEPWYYKTEKGFAESGEGQLVNAQIISKGPPETLVMAAWTCCDDNKCRKIDIERIVACVNACKGINPEAIPDLLLACKMIVVNIEAAVSSGRLVSTALFRQVEDAISKAKLR